MDYNALLQKVSDWFFDKSRSILKKILAAAIIIFVVFIIDDYFKFSYNFKINSQIEQISKIEEVIKENDDSLLVKELKSIEKKIINNQTKEDYLSSLSNLIYQRIKNTSNIISANPILHYFSSNLILILLFFWFYKEFKKYIVTKVIWYILAFGVLISLIFWLSGIITAFVIPSDTNFMLKLVLNVLFQLILLVFIYSWASYTNKKNN